MANVLGLAALAWTTRLAQAAPVAPSVAGDVVAGWLAVDPTPLAEKLSHRVKSIETVQGAQGTALYHVVHLAPSGFVLVAADDQIDPIIAFAPKGDFHPSAKNTLKALADKDLASRLAQAAARPAALRSAQARRKWQQFKEGTNAPAPGSANSVSSVSTVWVAPFLKSLWDQETVGDQGKTACYNYYTPPYAAGSATNYPSGCVATAMSQMMYYFQYPTAGVGAGSSTIFVNGSSQQATLRGGNGAGGPYQWSNMPPVLQNPTTTQCQAIGALSYDAGVSVNMSYASGGSGATLIGARDALAGTFLFPNVIIAGQDNPAYSLSPALTNIVNPNLDARKPVMFGIWASSAGHCVVCDGYGFIGGAMYHHINMGWSGYDNAWYALPDIDAAGSVDFTNISSCIYNVDVSSPGEILSGRIVDGAGNPVANATVTASRSGGGSYSATSDTNGIYALVRLPSSSHYTVTVNQAGYDTESANWSTGTSQNSTATTGNIWGANFVLPAAGPPTILSGPQNQTVFVGGTANFSVNAAGASSLSYLWSHNGAFLTNGDSMLTISNVSPAEAGTYAVVVSNALGVSAPATAVLSVQQKGPQLVQNGGFETGDFTAWSTSGNMEDTFVAGGSSSFVYAGNYGAVLQSPGSLGFLSQTLATTPGASYLVSCWLDSPYESTPNEFLIAWNGTNLFDDVDMGATGWTNLQFMAVAGADNTVLEFGFRNDYAYFGLDQITVNNVFLASAAPQITAQPAAQTAALGASASFSVTATGTPQVAYQWQFDGANLEGATNSTLTFAAVQASNSGYYQVVVSNSAGSVTSAEAALNVTGVPVAFGSGGGIQAGNGSVTLVLTNLTGQGSVVVQASADLTHWIPVFTNAPGFGGFQFTDSAVEGVPCRYYRTVVVTSP